MASYSTLEFDVQRLDKEIANLNQFIADVTEKIAKARFDEQIKQLGSEIRNLEGEREEITSELNSLQKHAETRASLRAAQSNLARVQARIDDAYVEFA